MDVFPLDSQALFIVLEEISSDWTCSHADREAANELRKQLLRDGFLFIIHFHHDLHECVLGKIFLHLIEMNKVYFLLSRSSDKSTLG